MSRALVLRAGGRVVRVVPAALGLACCAVEVATALLAADTDELPEGTPVDLDVLLVSGTVTRAMKADVLAAYDALPAATRRVVAVGACASTGGPYWDSPVVVPGVDRLVPVDLYVPGCPPPPAAVLAALADLASTTSAA